MDQEKFVNIIKEVVKDLAIEGSIRNLDKPAGRSSDIKLVEASEWCNTLDDNQKIQVKNIIEMAVDDSIFGFLCVIDGVRTIKDSIDSEEGVFKLSYIENKMESILNDPEDNYLHDIYNS